jgi:hypothetical protein
MPSVTIDAGVLAVPPGTWAADDIHRYVETLLEWKKLLNMPWVSIHMSEHGNDALVADGLFPLRDQLKRQFTATGIVEYDINDVVNIINQILKFTTFETNFRIRDVLTDELTIEPNILTHSLGISLQSHLTTCIVLIAILRRYCQKLMSDHILILRYAPVRII